MTGRSKRHINKALKNQHIVFDVWAEQLVSLFGLDTALAPYEKINLKAK
jgi:hypothetical protein